MSVHEVRVFKPAPAVYKLGLDRLGVDREQLLFVSSNGWDATGRDLAELAARLSLPNG